VFDLVIRGGSVVDGTGAPARTADVAITDGVITEVGALHGAAARREIDADGALVTPGVVDIHTHYDGQATWDPELSPSGWHGVTTAVMGNCGVGFAPCAPEKRAWLIELMEGVEDIPGTALHEGIRWEWETFPEYLDALARMPRSLDIGTQIAHGALRPYVMGERGARNEPATPDDIAEMARLVTEAIEAGALAFSTSRTMVHKAVDGEPVPGTFAAEDELFGIGRALGRLGRGLFELAPAGVVGEDVLAPERELDWMLRLSQEIGRPVTFAMTQNEACPDMWRKMLDLSRDAAAAGAQVRPQVAGRPSGLMFGLETTFHPFDDRPTFAALRPLPLAEQVARLADPEVRARIMGERQSYTDPMRAYLRTRFDRWFPLPEPLDYEPGPEQSVAGMAAAQGRHPEDVVYDLMLEDGGRRLINVPVLNYVAGDMDALREMLLHPAAALGLADGGAHVAIICDASTPTFMLTHWARDRSRGERLPLELVVRRQTHDTATLYGLLDRGVLAPGYRADVNVIDHDRLRLRAPRVAHDLPAGARRIVQEAEGYEATLVAGQLVRADDADTGARPGQLVRGAQSAPAA
jgi:N-acyl-D-amino-acid deacylase